VLVEKWCVNQWVLENVLYVVDCLRRPVQRLKLHVSKLSSCVTISFVWWSMTDPVEGECRWRCWESLTVQNVTRSLRYDAEQRWKMLCVVWSWRPWIWFWIWLATNEVVAQKRCGRPRVSLADWICWRRASVQREQSCSNQCIMSWIVIARLT